MRVIIIIALLASACATTKTSLSTGEAPTSRELSWTELSSEFSRAVAESVERGYAPLSIHLCTGESFPVTVVAFGPGDESDELDVLLEDGNRMAFPRHQLEIGDTIHCPVEWLWLTNQ